MKQDAASLKSDSNSTLGAASAKVGKGQAWERWWSGEEVQWMKVERGEVTIDDAVGGTKRTSNQRVDGNRLRGEQFLSTAAITADNLTKERRH